MYVHTYICACMYIILFFIEMSDKISQKMTSALLAMSLSYYYVMGEHVEKETRTDEILSTLLNCSQDKMHTSTKQTTGDYTHINSMCVEIATVFTWLNVTPLIVAALE